MRPGQRAAEKKRYGCLLQRLPGLRRAGAVGREDRAVDPGESGAFSWRQGVRQRPHDRVYTGQRCEIGAGWSWVAKPSGADLPQSRDRGAGVRGRAGCAAAYSSSTTRARPAPPRSPGGNRAPANRNAPPRTTAAGLLFESCSGACPYEIQPGSLYGWRFGRWFAISDAAASLTPTRSHPVGWMSPRASSRLCCYFHLRRSEWTKRLR